MAIRLANRVALASVTCVLAGCGTGGSATGTTVDVDGNGETTLKVIPGTGTATPLGDTGAGDDLVGTAVLQSIVPFTLSSLPVEVTGKITGTTVTYEKLCVTMDLCQYYDDNEIGVAVSMVPAGLVIKQYSTTFAWTTTTPVLVDGKPTVELSVEVTPQRYDSLTRIPACPRAFCTTRAATVSGAHVSLGETAFVGTIEVEMDLTDSTGAAFGASDVKVPLTGQTTMTPITDAANHLDVSNLSLPR